MNEVTLWLPDGLDLGPVMDRAGLGTKVVFAEWVVSEIVRWGRLYKVPAGGFVPLAVSRLRAGVPKDLVRPVKDALRPGVIECDGVYRPDPTGWGEGKCLEYRLAPGVSPEWSKVRRPAAELARKLRVANARRRAEVDAAVAELPPAYGALRRHMEAVRLVGAVADDPHPITEYLAGDLPRWFAVCAQGRVHHPVASCPRRLRPHLRFGQSDRPLALVDVAASQPTLLGLIVRRRLRGAGQSCPDTERFVTDFAGGGTTGGYGRSTGSSPRSGTLSPLRTSGRGEQVEFRVLRLGERYERPHVLELALVCDRQGFQHDSL